MIQIDLTQTIFLSAYTLLFAALLAWFIVYTRTNNKTKPNPEEIFVYLGLFLIVLLLFITGGYGVLKTVSHFHVAAICLVTLKHNGQTDQYDPFKTETITEDEAVMLSNYFSTAKPVPGFFKYNLIDDQDNMQTHESANGDLLGCMLTTLAQKSPVQNEQGPYIDKQVSITNFISQKKPGDENEAGVPKLNT